MSIEFYIPRQGDTAGTVTDGYAANFEALDAAKADKAAGKDLMTDAEREKLAGIEAQANRYVHPEVHPADMIADTPAKVVMTAQERDKLARVEPGANAYTLPAASADTLGGVRAGRNLTVDPDGTLHAPSPAGVEPDAVPALGQVAASDRLLAFNESGEPVTATAGKLREYAAEGLATADAVNTALDGKF
ncbi:MAG: hypothetical protein LIO68_00110, partial [Rikenellaceae bacterium]|nr:hypothetical protein [Rikenellaceae bacterium]